MSTSKYRFNRNDKKVISYFTAEQQIAILKDRAIFSDSIALRKRAIIELSAFGQAALSALQEVIDSESANTNDAGIFIGRFCRNAMDKIVVLNNQSTQQ
jgi:hypothetical protein